MKFLILANSQASALGLNENEPSYVEILTKNLECKGHSFIPYIFSGENIDFFLLNIENVILNKPDYVIIHLGVVEAARRILSKKEKNILRALPLSRHFTKFLHNNRNKVITWRKKLKICARDMSLPDFELKLKKLIKIFEQNKIKYYFLQIPYLCTDYEEKFFSYLGEDVDIYNSVIEKFNYIELPSFIRANNNTIYWQESSVHLSAKGHSCFARELLAEMDKEGII